jgi:hypothetical protein
VILLLPLSRSLAALPVGPPGGGGGKEQAEPGGATLCGSARGKWLQRVHFAGLRLWSRCCSARLGGLYLEPPVEPELEPSQRGPVSVSKKTPPSRPSPSRGAAAYLRSCHPTGRSPAIMVPVPPPPPSSSRRRRASDRRRCTLPSHPASVIHPASMRSSSRVHFSTSAVTVPTCCLTTPPSPVRRYLHHLPSAHAEPARRQCT